MALSPSTKLFGRYTQFIDDGVSRWLLALAAARKKQYKADALVSDVVAYSADAADVLSFQLRLLFPASAPVISFDIKTSTTTATETGSVPVIQPVVALESTHLEDDGGTNKIDKSLVTATLSSSGTSVIVELNSLTGLVATVYRGTIRTVVGKTTVAAVEVNVTA